MYVSSSIWSGIYISTVGEAFKLKEVIKKATDLEKWSMNFDEKLIDS